MTLKLKDGQPANFQKEDIRKVLTRRLSMKRWPGWAALGITLTAMAVAPMDSGDPQMISIPHAHATLTLPIAFAFFFGSRMGGIYEVQASTGDWFPQGPDAPRAQGEKPEDSK